MDKVNGSGQKANAYSVNITPHGDMQHGASPEYIVVEVVGHYGIIDIEERKIERSIYHQAPKKLMAELLPEIAKLREQLNEATTAVIECSGKLKGAVQSLEDIRGVAKAKSTGPAIQDTYMDIVNEAEEALRRIEK